MSYIQKMYIRSSGSNSYENFDKGDKVIRLNCSNWFHFCQILSGLASNQAWAWNDVMLLVIWFKKNKFRWATLNPITLELSDSWTLWKMQFFSQTAMFKFWNISILLCQSYLNFNKKSTELFIKLEITTVLFSLYNIQTMWTTSRSVCRLFFRSRSLFQKEQ